MKIKQTFKIFDDNLKHIDYDPKNIISGDTDSSFIDLSALFNKDADPEEVIDFSDNIGTETNTAFPQYVSDVFNIPKDRLDIIRTDREIVSDKSLFLAKKKYAMHVINKEGITKDNMKIMGMEIKKSDTPIIVQNFLKELVNIILEHKPIKEIIITIEKFKKFYFTQKMAEIGRPMNIKVLKKYEELHEEQGDMKGFPYHARASLFYNSLCKISDVRIYSGNKIKIIYIKHPDSKYIAIPVEADMLPNFLNNFDIDWDTMWNGVEKKIDIYTTKIFFDDFIKRLRDEKPELLQDIDLEMEIKTDDSKKIAKEIHNAMHTILTEIGKKIDFRKILKKEFFYKTITEMMEAILYYD